MLVLVLLAAPVFAQEAAVTPKTSGEVRNLEVGFPTQVVDTMTIPQGKFEFGLSMGYENFKGDAAVNDSFISVNPLVAYGIMPNLEVMFSMPLLLTEGTINYNTGIMGNTDQGANFDTDWGLLWRINEEGDVLPSFGIGLSVKAPTGYGADGWDGTALGVMTKTIGPVRLNINASITTIGKSNGNIITQDHLDSYGIGVDFPVMDNLVLIVDTFSSEDPQVTSGTARANVVEFGARFALTETDILSGSVGTSYGPGISPDLTLVVGYQKLL